MSPSLDSTSQERLRFHVSHRVRLLLLTASVLMVLAAPAQVNGQVEMIVRPADGSVLQQSLDRRAKTAASSRIDTLLRSVKAVDPIFGFDRLGKGGGAKPLVYLVTLRDSSDYTTVFANLSARPDVIYVQPNHEYELDSFASPDPYADSLSHLRVIETQTAWPITTGSADVVVGLVDTGIYFDHPDLLGQIAINAGEDLNRDGLFTAADLNGIDDDDNGYVDDVAGYDFVDRPSTVEAGDFRTADPDASDDGSGHGTNVAGIIAAARENGIGIAGVAPGVRIAPIRAFGRDGRGEDDDVARAILYAAEIGAQVLNLSFGDSYLSPVMLDAIRYAVDRGVVVVASAGNSGGDRPHYPSDHPEVISVVWLTADGTSLSSRASYGTGVDIGAPGSSVFTTLMPAGIDSSGEQELYGRRSGSSMAAPMVSAAAALLKSVSPTLSPQSVRSILTGTADDIGEPGWDHRSGAGLLKVGQALRFALPARTEITFPENDASVSGPVVEIRGSAIDPSFRSYEVYVSTGGSESSRTEWTPISAPVERQVLNGILATWNVASTPEGAYTLRLVVNLRSGKTVEERRRITIDRTPPEIRIKLLDDGLSHGRHAIIVDIETDDETRVAMQVTMGGQSTASLSDRVSRRHGLVIPDETLAGGSATVTIVATNAASLESTFSAVVNVPPNAADTGGWLSTPTTIPHGFLLDELVDFDGDGLPEIVFNLYENGWLGDTLAVYEWNGDFRRAASLLVSAFPRSTGDSNSDGRQELLAQVGPVTIILEQEPGGYPTGVAYVDSLGLTNSSEALWGARLFDLDGDGTDEIIGHNTKEWRVIEYDGSQYVERRRLQNPTTVVGSEIDQNSFEQPQLLTGDLDNDGRPDMLSGDSDGDWILYESVGNDDYAPVWTYETQLYNAAARMTDGDLDGDGTREIVTFAHNWLTTTTAGFQEPDIGTYFIFRMDGDNSFALVDSISVSGEISQHGTASAADLDGDGRDELVLINPPDLYVVDFDHDLKWSVAHHIGFDVPNGFDGTRSIKAVVADVDLDGAQEVVFGAADGRLYTLDRTAPSGVPAPSWISARAESESQVRLEWLGTGIDSTRIYRSESGSPLDELATTAATVFIDSVSVQTDYGLRGWRAGLLGPLSRVRTVRPHAPAVVAAIRYPSPARLEVEFTEPIQSGATTKNFALASGGLPASVIYLRGGRVLGLEFGTLTAGPDTLLLSGLFDAEGAPVTQNSLPIVIPAPTAATLIVASWRVEPPHTIELTFSSPLDSAYAQDASNYVLRPFGSVLSASWSTDRPQRVVLQVRGVAVGATGIGSELTISEMRSAAGEMLAAEGASIRLSDAAENLSSVYVFPNPVNRSRHQEGLMIAGLPAGASIQIFSPSGRHVRDLRDGTGAGGTRWNLTDDSGALVPSGIYLIRVTADGMRAILKKAAVIN